MSMKIQTNQSNQTTIIQSIKDCLRDPKSVLTSGLLTVNYSVKSTLGALKVGLLIEVALRTGSTMHMYICKCTCMLCIFGSSTTQTEILSAPYDHRICTHSKNNPKHPKFDLTRAETHEFQIMDSTF